MTFPLYYETAGESESTLPLVFVHAGIADSGMWDAQFAHFAASRRVVRCDLRGFGRSIPDGAPFSHYGDLSALMAHLGIGRAVFVGASMGGAAVFDLALTQPERVAGIAAVCSAPMGYGDFPDSEALEAEIEAADAAGDLERTNALEMQLWIDGFGRTEPVDPAVRARVSAMNRVALQHQAAQGRRSLLEPWAYSRMEAISVPTLLIAGAYDDPGYQRLNDLLVRRMTHAEALVMPTAHLPSMERPAELTAHLEAWLARTGL